ncbi:hypothetical protein EDD85DRAFT_742218, partial [Armillaria nabsnona]
KKVQAKDGKLIMYRVLAEHIFTGSDVDQEHCEEYGKDPTRFSWSTQQQFARLKKQYQRHVRKLKDTGGGVLPEDEAANVIEKIRNEWPFWDDLHAIWRELPNYNPVRISNAEGGQNHSEQAAHLFQTKT